MHALHIRQLRHKTLQRLQPARAEHPSLCPVAPGYEGGVLGRELPGFLQGLLDFPQAPHILPASWSRPLPRLHLPHAPAGCWLKALVCCLQIIQSKVQWPCGSHHTLRRSPACTPIASCRAFDCSLAPTSASKVAQAPCQTASSQSPSLMPAQSPSMPHPNHSGRCAVQCSAPSGCTATLDQLRRLSASLTGI